MSLATETINKQRRVYFTYIWKGLALMAIGGYCGFMIFKNGMGTAVQTGGGANAIVRKLMAWVEGYGMNAEQLLPLCMALLFGIIAAVGLFNVARGIWHMLPTHTMYGKFLKTQMKNTESFGDVIASIGADMAQEPYVFGTVSVGRKWMSDAEAMRLSGIRGVFWFDQGVEDYVLCCVDENQNIWAASLRYSDDRDKAAEHLKKILPDIASGDKNAYMAFLGGESVGDEQDDVPAVPALSLSGDTIFCFIGANGIPTSNFTTETACQSLRALPDSASVALKVLVPKDSTVSEIRFSREGSEWKLDVVYRQDDEEQHIVRSVDENAAITILESLIEKICLPDFCSR